MNITVTARHARYSRELKDTARRKAEHLLHYFDHLTKMEVIFDQNGHKGGFGCEIIAHAVRGHVLVVHSSHDSAEAALEVAHNRMERQLTKFKERLIGRHHHAAERRGRRVEDGENGVAGDIWW